MRRLFILIASTTALYLGTVAGFGYFAHAYSEHKTEALVRHATVEFVSSLDTLVGASLSQVAISLADSLGRPVEKSVEDMQLLARTYGLGEINFVDRKGMIVASTDSRCVGNTMDSGPAADFMALTNPATAMVTQPFRPGVYNSDVVMKYLGVRFPDDNGFIQVGKELSSVERSFNTVLPWICNGWIIGETGYFVIVDRTGRVIQCCRPGAGSAEYPSLADIGYIEPFGGDTDRKIHRQRLFGENATCLDSHYANFRAICVVPDSEFYDGSMTLVVNAALWLLALFLLFAWLLFSNMCGKDRLQVLYAEQDRRNREDQENARMIQVSAMPSVFPPFPHDLRHDVYAEMLPAREVGGDFYDFFYVSESRIAIVMADASGKGVPAAMFMMKAKTLIKSLVASIADLGEAMTEVNRRLCENNDAMMFVTCWIGVIELADGRVACVNAGHNPPFIRRLNGQVEQLCEVSGLFLGGMPDIGYATYTRRLGKGDMIVLYTDGISEAENAKHEQFGEERIARCLAAGGSPRDLCLRVRSQAQAFAAGATQFDDMTTLAFVYRGRPRSHSLTFPSELGSVSRASEFCDRELHSVGCQDETLGKALIVVDEIANNIVSYAGAKEFTVNCETADFPPMAQITVSDCGRPWNPLTHSDPDVTVPEDQRKVGGLGILIVKQLCDWVNYEYKDGQNVVTMRVDLPWRPLSARIIKGV